MYATIAWAIVRFVAVMVVSYFVNQALTPRPKSNNPEAVSQNDWNFPQTDEGLSQCVFFGDCWTQDWQVLAYGNYRTTEIRRG
ncbi:Uncharacterised protein [uncultured Avibacterium sp.]|uniref:Uncharacterized protein n=1 Tax=uncultured Avibacterium sp. TaxID=1936169 RepID=A0A486XGB7_9PAST|nr:Uncharacterised protein [uncultured Avibacterium sp.]